MPVGYKPNATFETGRVSEDALSILDVTLEEIDFDEKILDEISEMLDKQEKLELYEKQNIKKIDTLEHHIKAAKEALSKAEEKRSTLMMINDNLKAKVDKKLQTVNEAVQYWNDIKGIDVKKISTDNDDFKEYEFEFSKFPNSKRIQRRLENKDIDILSNHDNLTEQFNYKVGIRHHDNRLTIVSQKPELIKPDEIDEFNDTLTQTCICSSEEGLIVDYKLAILKIKEFILKSP